MRQIIVLGLTLLLSLCTHAQTQSAMNEDAMKQYQQKDKELNKVYQQILKENADDTAFIRTVKTAQRVWIQFRDAEVKMMFPDREPTFYGSMLPMCRYAYLAELTDERVIKLRRWIDGEDGNCESSIPEKKARR